MGEDLSPGRAVDAQPRNRAVPVAQMLVLLFEGAKTAPLERVALDVPAAALLFPILRRIPWPGRQPGEAPVLTEGRIHRIDVGVVETCPDHRRLQVVVTDDARHSPKVSEGVLVQTQKGRDLLIPYRLLVAVPGMA